MNKKKAIKAFRDNLQDTTPLTFPICVDTFTNYWNHEFGSFNELPKEIDEMIAKRGFDLGLLEDNDL